jgi:PBP1b-binding outer membrane lipoprotein LpoB
MRKKHYLVPILGLMMAFLLVGCAGNEEPADTTSNGDSQSAETSQTEEVQALQVSVEGNVENPLDFSLSDFEGQEVTIEAQKPLTWQFPCYLTARYFAHQAGPGLHGV